MERKKSLLRLAKGVPEEEGDRDKDTADLNRDCKDSFHYSGELAITEKCAKTESTSIVVNRIRELLESTRKSVIMSLLYMYYLFYIEIHYSQCTFNFYVITINSAIMNNLLLISFILKYSFNSDF